MPNANTTTYTPRQEVRVRHVWRTDGSSYLVPADTTTSTNIPQSGVMTLVRAGTVTPFFNSPTLRPKRLPTNGFSFSKTKKVGAVIDSWVQLVSDGIWRYQTTYSGGASTIAGPSMSFNSLSPQGIDNLSSRAATKTRLAVKDQKVNLFQAYAERDQTARLLASTVTRITKSLLSLKKGNFVQAARELGIVVSKRRARRARQEFRTRRPPKGKKTKRERESQVSRKARNDKFISQSWLELQYGWLPLLNDVYGAGQALAQSQFREVINKTSRSQYQKSSDVLVTFPGGGSKDTITRNSETTIKYVVYFGSSSNSPSGLTHTLAQVGLTNPLLIMWELMPFSFVIDWFLPIGNYISSLDATLGLTFIGGSKTIFTRSTTKGTRSLSSSASPTSYGSVTDFWEEVKVTRSALTTWPETSLPSFKNPVSFTHAANAIALANQLFRK